MRYTSGSGKKFLLIVIGVLVLMPTLAQAQEAGGKFTLAKQVRWGTAVLPAGEYNYRVERHAAGTVMLHSLTGGPSAIVMSTSSSLASADAAPSLLLTQHGQDWFVTSFILGGDGEELHFTPHIAVVSLPEAKSGPRVADVTTNTTP